ncbi:MAG: hypothetical protein GY757_21400 [bacterium]|nr:hypothetical protein [bacterium]
MRTKLFLVSVFIVITGMGVSLYAEKLASLPELMKPGNICVDGTQMYVVDTATNTIHLYSMKDYKLIKQFGKKGDGPGEYKSAPEVVAYPDYVLLDTFGKVIFYSRNGDYLKEKRLTNRMGGMVPVKDGYVGFSLKVSEDGKSFSQEIVLFDGEFKNLKTVSSLSKEEKAGKLVRVAFRDYYGYKLAGDNIYVANTKKGFFFEVFDSTGKKLFEINNKYKKKEVSQERKDEFKKKFFDRMKKNKYWDLMKDKLKVTYNDNFPAFKTFEIDNGKIYAFTFKKEGEKYELIVMDLKGKELKRLFVEPSRGKYSINNNKYYYIKENEETEEWELFVENL